MTLRLDISERFAGTFTRLPERVAAAVADSIVRLRDDYRHPSLRFKKLSGSSFYTARVHKNAEGYRIVMERLGPNHFILVGVGPHDVLRRLPPRKKPV